MLMWMTLNPVLIYTTSHNRYVHIHNMGNLCTTSLYNTHVIYFLSACDESQEMLEICYFSCDCNNYYVFFIFIFWIPRIIDHVTWLLMVSRSMNFVIESISKQPHIVWPNISSIVIRLIHSWFVQTNLTLTHDLGRQTSHLFVSTLVYFYYLRDISTFIG